MQESKITADKQAKTGIDDSPPKKRQRAHVNINKGEEHANKKRYTGSFLYKASFNPQWTKTGPCIVPSRECKHSFCCTLCNTAFAGHLDKREIHLHDW